MDVFSGTQFIECGPMSNVMALEEIFLFNKFSPFSVRALVLRRQSWTKLCDTAQMAIFCVVYFHTVARAEAYHRTKWHLDPYSCLATTNMGQKLGAVPPFWGRGAGSPSSTMWHGPRPTSIPSGILILAAVRPQ